MVVPPNAAEREPVQKSSAVISPFEDSDLCRGRVAGAHCCADGGDPTCCDGDIACVLAGVVD